MTSHDIPVEQIRAILGKDRQSMLIKEYNENLRLKQYQHICSYDIRVYGQSKTWLRCRCGKWKEESYDTRYAE